MNFKEQNKTRPRPWIKYYSSPSAADLEYPDGTMYDVFRDAALRNPDAPAIDYMTSRMTFQTLHREVLRCAAALKELGAGRGDRITVCLPNIPQAVIIFYAILYIGAEANMIHPLSSGNEIEFYMNESKSKILFMFDAFFGKTEGIRCPYLQKTVFAGAADLLPFYLRAGFRLTQGRKIKKPQETASVCSWKTFLGKYKNAELRDDFGASDLKCTDTAVILYSGGTSGVQKGILLSHLNFNALAEQTAANGTESILPGDTMLAVLPMFHGFGLGVCIHTAIAKGVTVILVPRFDADSFAELLRKKKPSFIAGVPTLYEALLRNDRLRGVDFSGIKGSFFRR